MAGVVVYVSSGGPVYLVCVQALLSCAGPSCAAGARALKTCSGWAMPVGSSSRERFGEFGALRDMRRGPKAGGLDLRPASNEAYKKSLDV